MILPFGSSNSDIIIQEDLISEPSGITKYGSPTFDANGMTGNIAGDGISFDAVTGHEDAAWAGQISVTLDAGDIASGDTATEYHSHNGDSDQGYVFTSQSASGWNDGIALTCGAAVTTQSRFTFNAKTGTTVAGRSFFNNSKIVTADPVLTMSWVGRSFRYFTDGVDAGVHTEAAQTLARDWLGKLYFGRRGLGGAEYLGRPIKNIQLAKVPVVLAVPPLLQKAVVFGDSFSNSKEATTTVGYGFQAGKIQQLQRVLAEKGFAINDFALLSQGGHTVQDNSASTLESKRSLVADEDPTVIFFQAAANDQGIFVAATFEADMKDHLTYFVNNCPHLKGVVVGELPKNTNVGRYGDAYAIAVNQIFNSLVSWWNATYPALAGKLAIAKIYGRVGDDMENYGIVDTLHPSSIGSYNFGVAWGEATLRIKQ